MDETAHRGGAGTHSCAGAVPAWPLHCLGKWGMGTPRDEQASPSRPPPRTHAMRRERESSKGRGRKGEEDK